MSSLRFFEVGLGCVFGAILNFMFGYWINVVLLVVGLLALVIGFLESRKPETITATTDMGMSKSFIQSAKDRFPK